MRDAEPKAVRLQDYRPPDFLISDTHLRFDIEDGGTEVTARLSLRRNPEGDPDAAALRLDGDNLELISVAVDGRLLGHNEYQRDEQSLTLSEVPDACEVTIVTRIVPETNTTLEGLYKSGGMYCTQCEAEGFRRMTYYLDRPDVLSRFTTTIVADAARYPVMLSNGNRIEQQALGGNRVAVTWEDPYPKPSYLFALVAGNLAALRDSFRTISGRVVALEIYSEPHNIDQCHYAMGALKRAMRWDEAVFGREYDLDVFMIVAVEDFNMGAMENKGLNIFNTSCVLASADTATDAAHQRVEGVVGHEYFHNWSGNRVTCRDWFQLSLKEGFTVFRDAEFSADMNSRTVKRVQDVEFLRTHQFAEDAGPMAHPVRPSSYIEISNFYTLTVYEKGAEVVRMIHTLLGPERFRRGSDLYFERHDGGAATTEDFVRAMEDATGVDLAQFRYWYSQAGTPEVAVSSTFAGDNLSLRFVQSCPSTPGQADKAPFHIPMAIGALDRNGSELLGAAGSSAVSVQSDTLIENPKRDGTLIVHLKEAVTDVAISGLSAPPELSLLRGFSAPVRLKAPRSAESLSFLAVNDSDGFSRWDAMRTLQFEALTDRDSHLEEVLPQLYAELLSGCRELADDGEAKALLAAMLMLPAEEAVHDVVDTIDVEAIHTARSTWKQRLGDRFFDEWLRVFETNADGGTYSPDPVSIARRSLRNLALAFLAAGRPTLSEALIFGQLNDADNLTDRLAAFNEILNLPDLDEGRRQACVDSFYERWASEKLVIDQWFGAQAACMRPGARQRLDALVSHEAFDTNPNRLRAVYGTLAQRNPVAFHAPDGSGYEFLADRVLSLDATNPQIAARLAAPFSRWRRFDSARQARMRAVLERLASAVQSKDVFEIVTKSLAD